MDKNILVIALGGTIGSVRGDTISLAPNSLRILDYYSADGVRFDSAAPFSILSENMDVEHWRCLFDYLTNVDYAAYDGVIILHGSDTLAYTAAMVGNAFCNRDIVLVAADKPLDDPDSNGAPNFAMAVNHLLSGKRGVYVAYDGIMPALGITGAGVDDKFLCIQSSAAPVGSTTIYPRNVLMVQPYVGMCADRYNLDDVDAVLIGMYHSATVPPAALELSRRAKQRGVPCSFVTHRLSADYDSMRGVDNIIFGSTMENALARLLLTK